MLKAIAKARKPPGSALPRRARLRHGDEARHAGTRPQTYPFVSYCLYLERCLEAAPRHRACCARVPPSGSPFPPEPYAHRRHTPQPHARWEAIRLNLNGSGAPSDLRREHPEPRGITVTGTARGLAPRFPQTRRKTAHSCVSAPPSRPSIKTVNMLSRKRASHAGEAQGKSYCLRKENAVTVAASSACRRGC